MQIIAPTGPNCAPDRRVSIADCSDYEFFDSNSTVKHSLSMVEIQAFVPDGWVDRPVIMVCLSGNSGYADKALSANEAREVAESLILAANEADVLRGIRKA